MKLAHIDPPNVEVILLAPIQVGMPPQVMPGAPVRGTYAPVVSIVDRVIDGANGTFGVRLSLPNPGNRLPAGLRCRGIFPPK